MADPAHSGHAGSDAFSSASHPATTRGHALGGPRFYDAFANVFFFGRRRATFETLTAAADVRPGQRVLDVGCGTGYFARLLARTVGPDGLVVGIDPSPEMIGYASREARHAWNCQFKVGTAESLDFPAEHFDVVVSSLVMHHLPVDLQVPALREMRRVLRSGGKLLVADARRPPHGLGWRLLLLITGHGRMVRMAPDLEPLAAQAKFTEIHTGEVLPWLRYVQAVKTANTTPRDAEGGSDG
jgi:ubiquinone/menaquinone biosynthesis C-methylase UbiE